jgi:hypothetical protein
VGSANPEVLAGDRIVASARNAQLEQSPVRPNGNTDGFRVVIWYLPPRGALDQNVLSESDRHDLEALGYL